jgi:hypothetical protein
VRALEGPGLTPLTKWAEAGPLSVRLSLTGRPPRRGQVRRRVMTVTERPFGCAQRVTVRPLRPSPSARPDQVP